MDTNHGSAPRNCGTGGSHAGQRHTSEAAIANFFYDFVLVLEAWSRSGSALGPRTVGGFVENSHGEEMELRLLVSLTCEMMLKSDWQTAYPKKQRSVLDQHGLTEHCPQWPKSRWSRFDAGSKSRRN
jgi:hypothetical protein